MTDKPIEVNGKEIVVREDTYKAYRAVHWMGIVLALMVLIVLVAFISGLFSAGVDGDLDSPGKIENSSRN